MSKEFFEGFKILEKELEDIIKKTNDVQDVLEVGAKNFVIDLKKLAKPISKIKKAGYTHLIRTFAYRKTKKSEIEVGWGKYYGPMVEYGTSKMASRQHIRPTWNKNKEKYYKKMLTYVGLER